MIFRRRSEGSRLSDEPLVIAPADRFGRVALLAIVIVVLAVLVGGAIRYFEEHFAPVLRITVLEDENRALRETIGELRESLNRANLDVEVEAATRVELERQIAALNEQLKATKDELEFIRSASEEPKKR